MGTGSPGVTRLSALSLAGVPRRDVAHCAAVAHGLPETGPPLPRCRELPHDGDRHTRPNYTVA